LVFIIIPLIAGSAIFGADLKKYEYLLDKPKQFLWLLVPFFGIALLIALVKIRLKGKEDLFWWWWS